MTFLWYCVCGLFFFTTVKATKGLVGGIEEIPVNNSGVLRSAQFALDKYNNASNDMFINKITQIFNAKLQVVSGIMYQFGAKIGRTDCMKRNFPNAESCPSAPSHDQQIICDFEVLDVVWLETMELLKMDCNPENY